MSGFLIFWLVCLTVNLLLGMFYIHSGSPSRQDGMGYVFFALVPGVNFIMAGASFIYMIVTIVNSDWAKEPIRSKK